MGQNFPPNSIITCILDACQLNRLDWREFFPPNLEENFVPSHVKLKDTWNIFIENGRKL